jgi:hypothetical protein
MYFIVGELKDDESLRRWKEQLLGSVDLNSMGGKLTNFVINLKSFFFFLMIFRLLLGTHIRKGCVNLSTMIVCDAVASIVCKSCNHPIYLF